MTKDSFHILKSNANFHSEIYLTNRFIHRCIMFVIYEPIQESAFQFNLVTRILTRGTRNFLHSFELSRFLYTLFGTYLDGSVTKWGSNLVYSLTIKNLIPESGTDPLKSSIDLAMEMLLKANWSQKTFFFDYFREEKKNQLIELKDLKNDRFRYAFEHFLRWMFRKEPFGVSVLGSINKLASLSNQELSSYYLDHFLHQNRMVFFLDHEMNPLYREVVSAFSDFKPTLLQSKEVISPVLYKSGQVRRRTESDQNQQTWIFMGYRFFRKTDASLTPALILFNNLLGGQSNSLLFRKIREEKGLCYFVNSSLPAGIDALIISAGIERKKQKQFENNVEKVIYDLSREKLSIEDMETAKKLTKFSLCSIFEHPSQLISMRIESVLLQRDYSLKDLINRIEKVTPEEIKLIASWIFLDCVYLLEGTE